MANLYQQAIGVALNDAKSMLGKNEVPNRSEIMEYLHDGGQDLDPHKVAWCAAFVSASLQKAGLPVPTQVVKDSAFGPGAYAPNYLSYGGAVEPKDIQAGDILVSNDGHHVGFAEGPIRQGPNGPEVQLLAGNERDPSGQYTPGSYTSPTGAVANRAQVGMVGERWVPLSQYSARRYQPTDDSASSSSSQPARPGQTTAPATAVTASTPFSLSAPSGSIPSAGQYQPLIDAAAKKYNIDPNFFSRLLYQENRFRPQGTSSAGAQGFAQFIPSTAARYGVDVNDPASSIEGAAHYLSDLSGRYNGNLGLAAAGYNWGENNVDKWLQGKSKPPSETINYVNTITGHSMDEWKADPRLPVGPFTGPGRAPSGAAPGTTINSAPGVAPAGATGGQSWDDKLGAVTKDVGKAMGWDQPAGGGGGENEFKFQPMPPASMRNVSPLLPYASAIGQKITGYSPQIYGQSLTSMKDPLQWGTAAPGQNPWAGAGPQAPPGTSLTSMNPMQMQAAMLAPYYGYGLAGMEDFGGASYG